MSKIHVGQIAKQITTLFEDKLDLSDIGTNDTDSESKILTRCLAAYAVYVASSCSLEDAAASITDGHDDNGIDAIHYSEQFNKLTIVQSKWRHDGSGEPSKRDVLIFVNGAKDLFDLKFENFNAKVRDRSSTIESVFTDFNVSFELIWIDTCAKSELVEENIQPLMDFIYAMNDTGEADPVPIMTFTRMNQSSVHSALSRSVSNPQVSVDLTLENWGAVTEPYKAYYGKITVQQIASWWEKFGDKMFERNIRKVLGKTDVNEEIERTLMNEPQLFWYFNNGITIVAEKIDKSMQGATSKEIGVFRLNNFSVVNGAQTASSIGRFFSKNKDNEIAEDAFVNIKLIEITQDEGLVKLITRANNRQNKIEGMDFASQDPEQHRIKNELVLEEISYSIMRTDSFKPTEKSFNIQEATTALASVSQNINLAVKVKNAIGKFFENLDRGIYKEVFNSSTTGYKAYNAVIFVRKIDALLEERVSDLEKRSGKKYGILIHGNRMVSHIVAAKMGIHKHLDSRELPLDEDKLTEILDKVIEDIESFISLKYPDSLLASFFKNITKCTELKTFIVNKDKQVSASIPNEVPRIMK